MSHCTCDYHQGQNKNLRMDNEMLSIHPPMLHQPSEEKKEYPICDTDDSGLCISPENHPASEEKKEECDREFCSKLVFRGEKSCTGTILFENSELECPCSCHKNSEQPQKIEEIVEKSEDSHEKCEGKKDWEELDYEDELVDYGMERGLARKFVSMQKTNLESFFREKLAREMETQKRTLENL